jgi:acyl carrier protein
MELNGADLRKRPDRLPARLQDGVGRESSQRLGSRYRSGRSPDWLQFKNPLVGGSDAVLDGPGEDRSCDRRRCVWLCGGGCLDCEQITTFAIFFVAAPNPNLLRGSVIEPDSNRGGLNMATVKLASVQNATVSQEPSLHDVRLLISEHLDIEARFVTSAIYDLGADFLDRIELMIAIEDRFDVEITDDDIEQFQVVGDLVSHLASQLGCAR